jgi:hypothetical protein
LQLNSGGAAAPISGSRQMGIVRALLAPLLLKPSSLVRRKVERLEQQLLPAGQPDAPMLVIHLRRTDKMHEMPAWFQDAFNATPGDPGVKSWGDYRQSLRSIVALVKYAERLAGRPYGAFFVISDDPELVEEDALSHLQSAFAQRPTPLFNPFIREHFQGDSTWRAKGHQIFASNSAADADLDIELMTDVEFASRHGSHVVGCGRSGITQLIAQRLGAREGMDPNQLALFEDDAKTLPLAMKLGHH